MPRITQLPPAAAVTGAELIPVVQDGESRNLPASRFATAEQGNAAAQAARSVAGLVNWAKRRLSFPDWQPVNQQTGAGWPAFQAGLRDMADLAVVENELFTPAGDYSGLDSYAGGVVMRDGRVFLCPCKATEAAIYDPAADTLVSVPGTLAGNFAFAPGVLLQDGRVFLTPAYSTTARIYDPVTNTYSTPGGDYPGNLAHCCAILLPDGRVFMPAYYQNRNCRVYDPVNDTVAVYAFPCQTNGYTYAALMADGRVFICPFADATAKIFDPVTNTISNAGGTWPGIYGLAAGATLLIDGRLYLTPGTNNATAYLYDPQAETVTPANGSYPINPNTYTGGLLLPDGRVWVYPYNTKDNVMRVYNPFTDQLETYNHPMPGIATYQGSALLHDGRVILVPRRATKALIFGKVSNIAPLADNFVLSPFYNKF